MGYIFKVNTRVKVKEVRQTLTTMLILMDNDNYVFPLMNRVSFSFKNTFNCKLIFIGC